MQKSELINCLEQNPVIAAIGEDKWEDALAAPVQGAAFSLACLLVRQYIRAVPVRLDFSAPLSVTALS